MRRAVELARQAAALGEVPVGAVVVEASSGEIVGEGHNQPISLHDPTAHAEIVAMRQAAKRTGNYRLTGHDLYVTLEPCTMCSGAISFARINKLEFSALDKKGGAVLSGVQFFNSPSCHWRPEISHNQEFEAECAELLRQFFRSKRK